MEDGTGQVKIRLAVMISLGLYSTVLLSTLGMDGGIL